MTATLSMFNAFYPPILSSEGHHGTILSVPGHAQPRNLAVVVNNHHPGQAVLPQHMAHFTRPGIPKHQHALLRTSPPSVKYGCVEHHHGLSPAAPERSKERALHVCVHGVRSANARGRMRTSRGRDYAAPGARAANWRFKSYLKIRASPANRQWYAEIAQPRVPVPSSRPQRSRMRWRRRGRVRIRLLTSAMLTREVDRSRKVMRGRAGGRRLTFIMEASMRRPGMRSRSAWVRARSREARGERW